MKAIRATSPARGGQRRPPRVAILAAALLWLAAAVPVAAHQSLDATPQDLAARADRLWAAGEYRAADQLARQGLAAARTRAGAPASPGILDWVLRSARTSFSAGRIDAAESLYTEALDSLGTSPAIPASWKTLRGLRDIALDRRDTEAAMRWAQRCLATGEAICGPDAPGPAADLAALASAHLLADHIDRADSLIARAIGRALHGRPPSDAGDVSSPDPGEPWAADSGDPCELDAATLGALFQEQALIQLRRGRYDEAEAIYRRALALLERALGPGHPGITPALGGLAIVHRRRGDFAAARETYERVLDIRTHAYGPDHPRVATALNNLGVLLDHLGEIDDAVALLTRCLEIREATYGEDNAEVALTLITLSGALNMQGDQAGSVRTCRRAVEICERIFGEEHTQTARALARLAHILLQRGSIEEAEALYQRGLDITLAIQGSPHPDLASYLASLARCHLALGRLDEAEQETRRAIANAAAIYGEDHYRAAIHQRDLGRILLHQRRSEEARTLLEEAARIFEHSLGNDHPVLVRVHAGLAWTHLQEGRLDQAREQAAQALALSRASHGGPHLDFVGLLQLLALIEGLAGQREASLGFAAEAAYVALQLQEDIYPVTSEHEALVYARLPRQAVHFQLGLACALDPGDPGAQASPYEPHEPHEPDVATGAAAEFTLLAQMHGQVLDRMVSRLRLAEDPGVPDDAGADPWQAFGRAARRLANLAVRGPATGGRGDREAYGEELRAAREQKQEAERALAAAGWGAFCSPPLTPPPTPPASPAFIEQLVTALEPGETLVQFTCFPELAVSQAQWDRQSCRPDLTGFETGRQRYRAFCLSRRPAGWSRPTGVAAYVRVVDLGPAAPIDSLIGAYRDAVEAVPSHARPTARQEADYRRIARQLHERIWRPLDLDPDPEAPAPLRAHASTTAPALTFLVPDGLLHLVDVHTLLSAEGRLVIEDHRVHWLSSARDLPRLRNQARRAPSCGMLVVGNPACAQGDQDGAPAGGSDPAAHERGSRPPLCGDLLTDLDPLPGSEEEAFAVAASFTAHTGEPATTLLGREADEEAVVRGLHGKRALHFACHGFYCREYSESAPVRARDGEPWDAAITETVLQNPLLASGLILAPPAGGTPGAPPINTPIDTPADTTVDTPADRPVSSAEEHDGLLTAEELARVNLEGTEWVVLSACGSGLGSMRPGEGLFGLRRAFELAGARSVVMALWRVGDRPAAELMTRVHELHWSGLSTVDAVREAVLERMVEQRRRFGRVHPAAWGGIITEGDWR